MIGYQRARNRMIKTEVILRGIMDVRVLAAMQKVLRHLFVDDALRSQAYSGYALPIGEKQTISQPYTVALMTEALGLRGYEKILEIGTGSGYQTAVLAEIADRVFSVERLPSLACRAAYILRQLGYGNIMLKIADGTLGWPEKAPFDRIIVTAASPGVPQPLLAQLAMRGRMVIPVGDRDMQELIVLERLPGGFRKVKLGNVRFVHLMGRWGWEGYSEQ